MAVREAYGDSQTFWNTPRGREIQREGGVQNVAWAERLQRASGTIDLGEAKIVEPLSIEDKSGES